MKFLNSNFINGYMSKLTELPEHYIMNGQIYDKNSMSPIARQTIPIKSTNLNEINTLTTIFNNSLAGQSRIDTSTIMDSENYNIYYKIISNINNSNEAGIYKIINNNNDFTYLYTKLYSGYAEHIDIISQDANNIYLLVYRDNITLLDIINKNNLTKTNEIALFDSYSTSVLKDSTNYLYLYSLNFSTSENIIRFDKNKKEKDTSYTSGVLTGNVTTPIKTLIIDNSGEDIKFYSLQDSVFHKRSSNQNHNFIYTKNIFNTTNSEFKQTIVNVDFNGFNSEILNIITSNNSKSIFSELLRYDDKENNKVYITHFIYSYISNVDMDIKNSKMITYEIVDEDTWKVVDCVSFDPYLYRAILPINNNSSILALRNDGCEIYSWSNINSKYELINSIENSIISIGIDSNNNIFLQKNDTSVDIISKTVPLYLFADFEKEIYEFNYDDIDTNIVIYAKNFENNYISTTVTLQLIGNVKFKDDGSKIKTLSTSNSEMKIPVVITGAGKFQVFIKSI